MPDMAVWYLAHRLFSALAHAHALSDSKGRRTPVIHRDIQPAHIVMSQDAHVRLAGFGIAKISGTAGTTAVGFVKGTPAYMAPEQASGDRITQRVDVYAAGLVVWEMLSGRSVRPPNEVGQGAELLRLIAGRRFEPITSLRQDIPREIAAAIDACLAQSPAKRTIQCHEVERWLEKVVDVEGGRKQLRERMVQLRNANARNAPARRASVSPNKNQPAPMASQSRALSSRFPSVSTRVTGRLSERDEGEAPRSSHRSPPVGNSSFPAPATAADGNKGSTSTGASKQTPLLEMVPAADLSPIKNTPPDPTPSYDALTPPPFGPEADKEVSDFVAKLRRPPGVAPPEDAQVPVKLETNPHPSTGSRLEGGAYAEKLVSSQTHSKSENEQAQPRPSNFGDAVAVKTAQSVERKKTHPSFLYGGMIGFAAVVFLSVGIWFAMRAMANETPPVHSAAMASESPVVSLPEQRVRPAVSVGLAASAAASVTASAAHFDNSEMPPLPEMPSFLGGLFVHGPPEGTVYVTGVPLAETGEWIQIGCNRHYFVRVGSKPGPRGIHGTVWLAAGQSVMIRCMRGVEVAATPRYAAPQRP
ncbi:MAG: hypothetical protein CSA75_03005 [Sorangium cellulosum]|nr:MAG: hypothetical protein CSA75_03005 [Sorangium cellulosum]